MRIESFWGKMLIYCFFFTGCSLGDKTDLTSDLWWSRGVIVLFFNKRNVLPEVSLTLFFSSTSWERTWSSLWPSIRVRSPKWTQPQSWWTTVHHITQGWSLDSPEWSSVFQLIFFILEPFLWPWNLYTLWMKESKTDTVYIWKKVQKIQIF